MDSAAPGDLFKRRADAGPHVKKARRFTDIETDSDFDADDDGPARSSVSSLSFDVEATEKVSVSRDGRRQRSATSKVVDATSDHSVLFELSSDRGLSAAAAASPVAPPKSAAAHPPATASPKEPAGSTRRAKEERPLRALKEAEAAGGSPPSELQATLEAKEPPLAIASPGESGVATNDARHRVAASGGTRVEYRARPTDSSAGADDANEDCNSDGGFAESVLPSAKEVARPKPPLTTPPRLGAYADGDVGVSGSSGGGHVARAAPPDPSDELLLRARLRLQEKRRNDAAAAAGGSRAATPPRPSSHVINGDLLYSASHAAPSTPRHCAFYESSPTPADYSSTALGHHSTMLGAGAAAGFGRRPSGAWGASSPARSSPHMLEAKLRRLAQENERLQSEVAFLSKEGQKLRAMTRSFDSADAMKRELTIDMLRKELQAKEVGHQAALRDAEVKRESLANQVLELKENNTSYAATTLQYKSLYEEKVKEVEQVKLQVQRLMQDLGSLEHRQQSDAQQLQSSLAIEREKVEKLLFLLEDVKKQRQHFQELNQQLSIEQVGLNDERTRLKAALASLEERARHEAMISAQAVQALQQDVERLKAAAAETAKSHAAQLREEQRLAASLQHRLDQMALDGRDETDRLRRAIEAARQDHRRALAAEMESRVAAEERARRLEADLRASAAACREAFAVEHEEQLRRLQSDLVAAHGATDEARLQCDRLEEEVGRLRASLSYQSDQYHALSADFARSEEMRERSEQQCAALSATLQEMIQQDEQHTRRGAQLEAMVAGLRAQLDEVTAAVGPSVGGGLSESSLATQLQLLSNENERLTSECARLANERDNLIDESGRIAEELLKWKDEMRLFVSAHVRNGGS